MKISGDGDNGTTTSIQVGAESEIDGTIELSFKYIDNGIGVLYLYFYNESSDIIGFIFINSTNNLVSAQYGNGVGGNTTVNTALASDTWMHLKWSFDCATNKQSLWLDDVIIIDNENFRTDDVATTFLKHRFLYQEGGGSNALEAYIDNIGWKWDTNYNVGDNQYAEEGEPNQVVFEGIAKKPTKGRIQFVLIENQGSEMETISPRGNKSGRSDQIITDINNDGAPNGPTYITDGTLANGSAMGLLDLSGAKLLKTVYNDLAEHDVFLWNLRPQGTLDYNSGIVDSKVVIRNDITTYTDTILQVQAWTIPKLNQIIVNGAINPITGNPYTGIYNDSADQRAKGVNPITIEDAQLNTDALCQTKANNIGGNETIRIRARFKFRKSTYGLIQPGQTITFKYVIANYINIPEAQFILDKLIMNIKTEIGYAEISSGL